MGKLKWNIDKQFDFCYGHRVWNQNLNAEYSLDTCLACRHLHGHQGKIKVHLEGEINTEKVKQGMVTDFKHLNWFKEFIDKNFDHKIIFDINDPLLIDELSFIKKHTVGYNIEDIWIAHYKKSIKELDNLHPEVFYTINFALLNKIIDIEENKGNLIQEQAQAIFEKYEGIVLVEFVPTSENLTSFFANIIKAKMQKLSEVENFKVHSVEFWETPKSHCQVFLGE